MNYPSGWPPNQSGQGNGPFPPSGQQGQWRDPRVPFGSPDQHQATQFAGGLDPARDPRQSFAQAPPPQISAQDFAPRRSTSLVWFFVMVVVVIAGLVLATRLSGSDPSGTGSTRSSAAPQDVPSGVNGIPWETSGAKGFWQIDKAIFEADGVRVKMTIRVDEGSLSYDWFAFDNSGSGVVDPEYVDKDALRPGTVDAGNSATGWVKFETRSTPTTVIMTNGFGRQITGLTVKP